MNEPITLTPTPPSFITSTASLIVVSFIPTELNNYENLLEAKIEERWRDVERKGREDQKSRVKQGLRRSRSGWRRRRNDIDSSTSNATETALQLHFDYHRPFFIEFTNAFFNVSSNVFIVTDIPSSHVNITRTTSATGKGTIRPLVTSTISSTGANFKCDPIPL